MRNAACGWTFVRRFFVRQLFVRQFFVRQFFVHQVVARKAQARSAPARVDAGVFAVFADSAEAAFKHSLRALAVRVLA